MTTSKAGIALIKEFEGCRLKAYQDGAGIWTIGYGHAFARKDEYETQEQAEKDLCADLASAEHAVNSMVHAQLNQNQFDALVSFTYNEGAGRFRASSMLRYINAGSYLQAGMEFPKWDYVGPGISEGLLKRRVAEQALFLKAVVQ